MSSLNESVSRVREILLHPREQKPTIKQIFGSNLREYQNFINTLGNSSQPFTTLERQIVVNNSGTDYLVAQESGKILFVTASDNSISPSYPYSIEFTDLQDASTDWWSYYPLTAARPEDYNFTAFPLKIAFYRRDGQLYARVPQYYFNNTLTITVATGNWTSGIGAEQSAALTEYHHLPEIRSAMNLSVASRWTDDLNADMQTADRLFANLRLQEQRVLEDFNLAKRGLTASDVTWVETNDWMF